MGKQFANFFKCSTCTYMWSSNPILWYCVKLLQSCLTLCNPMDSSLPGCSPWNSLDTTTGVGCYSLLQGTFLTQGSNPSLTSAGRFCSFVFTTSAILEALFDTDWDINIYTHRETCAWMYTEAFFIMAKNWNQFIHQKKNKWIGTYSTLEYY